MCDPAVDASSPRDCRETPYNPSVVAAVVFDVGETSRLWRLCGGEGPGLLDFQDFFGCGWSGGCGEKSGGDDLAAEAQTSGSAPCR